MPLIDSLVSSASNTVAYFDDHQGFLTVVGWFAAAVLGLLFGLRQQKQALRDQARLEIYKDINQDKHQLIEAYIELSTTVSKFGLSTTFINLKGRKNGVTTDKTELDIWQEYSNRSLESISKFVDAYRKFWGSVDSWIGMMRDLQKAKDLYFKKLTDLSSSLWVLQREFSDLGTELIVDSASFYSKEKSLEEEIQTKYNEISETIGFTDDFMMLIHNELIGGVVGFTKRPREDVYVSAPVTISVLTNKGFKKVTMKPVTKKSPWYREVNLAGIPDDQENKRGV